MSEEPKQQGINFWVNGIVAVRDHKPYIQLSNEKGLIGQFTMSEARKIAQDLVVMASRTEMDAMVAAFFEKELEASPGAVGAAMQLFRDYRLNLDQEKIDHLYSDPEVL
jgi:hypothetical protein